MYNNALELKAIIEKTNSNISTVVLENECLLAETTPEIILERTYNILKVMKESATMGLEKDIRSISGFTGGEAKRMNLYSKTGNTICGSIINQAMAKAFSSAEVNASMGKVVAAPTAGSCGIVPAALFTCGELLRERLMKEAGGDFLGASGVGLGAEHITGGDAESAGAGGEHVSGVSGARAGGEQVSGVSGARAGGEQVSGAEEAAAAMCAGAKEVAEAEAVADRQAHAIYVTKLVDKKMAMGLLTAAGIGQIIAKNATLSGAEGGCQAECGAAAAMAAAALVEMYGGTPDMAFNAAGIAIMNILGLVCDPVAGLVELPCSRRNASGVVNAMSSADMGLAGVKSIIPFDEIVEAMYKVGKALPESLRETGMGGIADTPTGRRMACKLYDAEKDE